LDVIMCLEGQIPRKSFHKFYIHASNNHFHKLHLSWYHTSSCGAPTLQNRFPKSWFSIP